MANKKRVLSLLMAMIMMLSALPMEASAHHHHNKRKNEGEKVLVCENEKHHDHTAACYHEHTKDCKKHSDGCRKGRKNVCKHRKYHCGMDEKDLECGYQAHNSKCYDFVKEEHIKVDIENLFADRELGLKIGKAITKLTGLNAEKAASKNALIRAAMITAVQVSSLSREQKAEVIGLIKSDENGMMRVINWLWPTYTVQFVVDGVVVESDTVEHGAMPSFDGEEPVKAETVQYTYTFTGWDAEFVSVTENVTYTAVFEQIAKEYTVVFRNYKGEVIDTVVVLGGEAVTAPELTARMGYVFTGWGADLTSVTSNMELTAQYDYEYYAVSKLKINVGNGTPASGSTEGNHLSHWGKIYNARSYYSYYETYTTDSIMALTDFDYERTSAEAIPGNVDVNGVIYTNGEGSSDHYYVLLDNGTYVSCKAQYHLDYKASFYDVYTFVVDGVETKVTALMGVEPEAPAVSEKDGYEFEGWMIDENGDYVAKFAKLHKVTFYLPAMAGGGSRVFYVRDGETVEPYEVKDTADYDFVHWYLYEATANMNHLKAFDFSTPITADTRFDARVEAIKQEFVVGVYVMIDGKRVRIGTGSISDVANPKEFYGIYDNEVQRDKFSWNNVDLGETFDDITVDGVTYTYGEGSSDNYYTYDVHTLKVAKYSNKNEFYFYVLGDFQLFHNARVILTVGGTTRRIITLNRVMDSVEHGTVITSEWLHKNKLLDENCYLKNDVVIDRDGDFEVEFVDTNVTLVLWNGTSILKTVTLMVGNGTKITDQWLHDNNILDSNYELDANVGVVRVIDGAGEYNIYVRAK